jgi:hypothetical protein
MDIATITALLGNVKTATEIAKAIKDSGATLEAAEMKLKLADLISALADVKIEAATVQTQLLDAQGQIRKLEAAAKQRAALVWRQPCYWMPREPDGVEEPYCQACYDKELRLARLHEDDRGAYRCSVCGGYFETEARKAADRAEADAAVRNYRGGY